MRRKSRHVVPSPSSHLGPVRVPSAIRAPRNVSAAACPSSSRRIHRDEPAEIERARFAASSPLPSTSSPSSSTTAAGDIAVAIAYARSFLLLLGAKKVQRARGVTHGCHLHVALCRAPYKRTYARIRACTYMYVRTRTYTSPAENGEGVPRGLEGKGARGDEDGKRERSSKRIELATL